MSATAVALSSSPLFDEACLAIASLLSRSSGPTRSPTGPAPALSARASDHLGSGARRF